MLIVQPQGQYSFAASPPALTGSDPDALRTLYELRKKSLHIGPWSMWKLDTATIPLLPAHIQSTGMPMNSEFLGLSKDDANLTVTFQLQPYTDAGDQAPSRIYCEKVEMTAAGSLLTVAGPDGDSLLRTLSGGLLDDVGQVGRPGFTQYMPFPVALVSRSRNPKSLHRYFVWAMYGAWCDAIALPCGKKTLSKYQITLKSAYGNSKSNGIGKIFWV